MRFFLAVACFFRVLFGKALPQDFPAALLPVPPEKPMDVDKLKEELKPKLTSPAQKLKTVADPGAMSPLAALPPPGHTAKDGALQLLSLLQREGRLVDFLREPIDGYDDAAVGAAVRDIHRGCKKAIDDHFDMAPVMVGDEGVSITVEKGFDPQRIRLVGEVKGAPPFRGTLRHHGWLVQKVKLPQPTAGLDTSVVAPAEVEL